jgi:Ni,Fe-hydrogenase III small subunit
VSCGELSKVNREKFWNPQILNGAAMVLPVDLYIPGYPPHPLTILDGLLRLLDRLEKRHQTAEG